MARKYCQIFSTGFSSGARDGSRMMVRFFFDGGVPSGPIHQHNRMGLSRGG